MLSPEIIFNLLKANNVSFFTGIPDSLLKDFCAYISDHTTDAEHIIAANEGCSIGLAAGHYLSTDSVPFVYMQNSGLGNSINPLLSLADKRVYSIPMLLMIGWRGEPGIKDEPQHLKQGMVTIQLLEAMQIPYAILAADHPSATRQIITAFEYMLEHKAPYVLVVRKDTFESYKLKNNVLTNYELSREAALKFIVDKIPTDSVIVSTTGMISRELYELREELKQGHEKDFLTVGSMGHASQIALTIALNRPDKPVYCFDGDGALLMHAGGLSTIGKYNPSNFTHIVFNNGAHDSVGGQPTLSFDVDIVKWAKAAGYSHAFMVETTIELNRLLSNHSKGSIFIEVRIKKGARNDLGRPSSGPTDNKEQLMAYLKI